MKTSRTSHRLRPRSLVRKIGWLSALSMLAVSALAPSSTFATSAGVRHVTTCVQTCDRPKATESDEPSEEPTDSQEPTDSPSPTDSEQPSDSASPSDSQEPTDSASPSDSEQPSDSASPSDSQQPTDSQEPTDSQKPSDSESPSDSAPPTGEELGATGRPGVTPPSTDTGSITAVSSSNDGWRVILIAIAALIVVSLALVPAERGRRKR